jgi:glycosyltransferase involved in cell wall biosynthesis
MSVLPKVSIVVPVFNGARFLREAIDSALRQTYPNIEVVVVNDGSRDDGETDAIARAYGTRIQYHTKPNGGVASALNHAIGVMTGEYFSWLSHDDLYTPNKIACQIEHLRRLAFPTCVLWCDFVQIDETGVESSVVRSAPSPGRSFRSQAIPGGLVHGCSLLIPRICFEQCGTFREDLRTTQDYDLFFRISRDFTFIHAPEVLVKGRQHAHQGSRTIRSHRSEGESLCRWLFDELMHVDFASEGHTARARYASEYALTMMRRRLVQTSAHAASVAVTELVQAFSGWRLWNFARRGL